MRFDKSAGMSFELILFMVFLIFGGILVSLFTYVLDENLQPVLENQIPLTHPDRTEIIAENESLMNYWGFVPIAIVIVLAIYVINNALISRGSNRQ